jgi:hypothetical protein
VVNASKKGSGIMAKRALKVVVPSEPIKLDLGCGKNKKEGFLGVDRRKFPGVDLVQDLLKPWQWKNDTVEEIHMSQVMEHFTGIQRVFIVNEMYRVLQKGGKATVITPHWCSNRAYGDFTHQWPPVSEMWFYYLSKTWRKDNAPDNDIEWNPDGYACDFECTWGYGMHPDFATKAQERQQFSMSFYKEAVTDIHATMVKK